MREPRGAMAQVRTPAATPKTRSLPQSTMDAPSAMGQFCQVQGVMQLALPRLFDAHQGHPGGYGTRIQLEGDRLHLACLSAAILEPDRERPQPMDDRALAPKQQARSSL